MPDDSALYLYSKAEIDEVFRPEYRFAIRMLADAAKRNFSMGYLRFYAGDGPLADYRSMDAVFGGMRIEVMDLRVAEDRFVNLIKTTDFFRLTTIQGLKEMKLELVGSNRYVPPPRPRPYAYPLFMTHVGGGVTAGTGRGTDTSVYRTSSFDSPIPPKKQI